MNRLLEALKTARKAEILIIVALACMLLLCLGGDREARIVSTEVEVRLECVLSEIEGAGKVCVMLSENDEEQPLGAVVVAQGADEMHVVLEIQRAVKALTGLETQYIEVIKSGK